MSEVDDFTVLVNLAEDNADLRFYIVPTVTVDTWLNADFKKWVEAPGKLGRAHDPSNTKRNLSEKSRQEELLAYLGKWDVLWK
jgi:hypothetical protein